MLAVHELTTNALKYGALSVPYDKVTVRWNIVEKQDRQWLSFDRNESGPPAQTVRTSPGAFASGANLSKDGYNIK